MVSNKTNAQSIRIMQAIVHYHRLLIGIGTSSEHYIQIYNDILSCLNAASNHTEATSLLRKKANEHDDDNQWRCCLLDAIYYLEYTATDSFPAFFDVEAILFRYADTFGNSFFKLVDGATMISVQKVVHYALPHNEVVGIVSRYKDGWLMDIKRFEHPLSMYALYQYLRTRYTDNELWVLYYNTYQTQEEGK